MSNLFGGSIDLLRQGAELAARRHELLAQNIANAETPGFQARDLSFARELSLAQQVKSLPAPDGLAPALDTRIVESPDEARRADGNTVDIDRQMPRLAVNAMYQNTVIQLLNARFKALRSAINGTV
jgi:flagellar basal-body rod protein FlgB